MTNDGSLPSQLDVMVGVVFLQLTGSGDQRVRLWDVVTGASLGEFFSHAGSVKAVHSKKDEPSEYVVC